jgi:hypothetical protein
MRAWRILLGAATAAAAVATTGCADDEAAVCGNGVVEAGEACDDGGKNSDQLAGACRTMCALPACGDGVVDPSEICDGDSADPGRACAATCDALGCLVGTTHETVDAAVGDASCEVVLVPSGTFVGNLILDRDVTLEGDGPLGADGSPSSILDGGAAASVITILADVNVIVSKISITNGASDLGGGIHNSGALTLLDSVVQGNAAGAAGAGIYSVGGSVTLERSAVALNTLTVTGAATAGGGGIHIEGGALKVQGGSAVTNNAVTLDWSGGQPAAFGGGISAAGAALEVRDESQIQGNTVEAIGQAVEAKGGGIFVDGGSLLLTGGAAVSDNSARGTSSGGAAVGRGGGVFSTNADVSIVTAELYGNEAVASADSDDPSVQATAQGGGLYGDGHLVTIDGGATIVSNTAVSSALRDAVAEGGGVHVRNGDLVLQDRSTVAGNSAESESTVTGAPALSYAIGGGIHALSSNVTSFDCYLDDNLARAVSADGDALAVGGAIGALGGTIDVSWSKIRDNLAEGRSHGAGAADSLAGALSCAADAGSTITIATVRDSTLSGNTALAVAEGAGEGSAAGGAISVRAGADQVQSKILIDRSTLSANTARGDDSGGGLGVAGAIQGVGGAGTSLVSLELTNSTVSGNLAVGDMAGVEGAGSADAGGILIQGGDTSATAELFLSSVTVADNLASGALASSGGGVRVAGGVLPAVTTAIVRNSLVAGNTAAAGADCETQGATLTSDGYNLLGDSALCVIDGDPTGNQLDVDPMLDVLDRNGASNWTHALLPGSPAIDAGDPAGCTDQGGAPLATDERGEARVQGASCDLGAYEVVP